MKLLSRYLSLLMFVFFAAAPRTGLAQTAEAGDGTPGVVTTPHLTVELASLAPEIARGGSAQVGLLFHLQEHWHVYWVNAGDAGMPPKVMWMLPQGITAGPLMFPTPSRLAQGPLMDFGYEDTVAFPVTIDAATSTATGPARLDAHVQWLVCREVCIPGKAHVGLDLKVVTHAAPAAALTGPLGDAINNLPKTLPADAKLSVLGGKSEFVVTLANFHPQSKAEFYPFDADQIANAAPQVVESTADGVRVHVPRAAELKTLPATLHGVLKLPGQGAFDVSSSIVPGEAPLASTSSNSSGALTVISAISLAFFGGIILNLMPCVFPVLFLKGLALVQSSREERSRMRAHGLIYTLGILASFWLIVGVLMVLRASGSQAAWGFQLQSPVFIAVLSSGLFFFALSLAGQFDLGLSLTSAGGELAKKEGLTGSFFTGVLATIVATPCTAPLMGAAIGFALAQPPLVTFAIFTALGFGLSVPYLLLTLQPAWTRWLPRPGVWMETMKQITAVPLFATAIWLVWVYGRLFTSDTGDGADHMARLLCCLLVIAIAGWVLHKWPAKWGSTVAAVCLGIFALAIPLTSAKPHALKWEPYSQAALDQARAGGHPVLIDFTAAWCLSCQVNEKLVLKASDIESELTSRGFVTMRADWTQYDPEITKQLASVGRSGVPAYVLYPAPPGSKADVLPELLTKSLVMAAINRDSTHTSALASNRQ